MLSEHSQFDRRGRVTAVEIRPYTGFPAEQLERSPIGVVPNQARKHCLSAYRDGIGRHVGSAANAVLL
jgi:hypothetical protein